MQISSSQAGMSLIEMVVFIVVTSIAISAVFIAFTVPMQQTPNSNAQTTATQLAQNRMEIILGQERLLGFASFSDPCTGATPPAVCTVSAALSAYTTTSTLTATTISGDTNYIIIDVLVTGPLNVRADLKTLVSDN